MTERTGAWIFSARQCAKEATFGKKKNEKLGGVEPKELPITRSSLSATVVYRMLQKNAFSCWLEEVLASGLKKPARTNRPESFGLERDRLNEPGGQVVFRVAGGMCGVRDRDVEAEENTVLWHSATLKEPEALRVKQGWLRSGRRGRQRPTARLDLDAIEALEVAANSDECGS